MLINLNESLDKCNMLTINPAIVFTDARYPTVRNAHKFMKIIEQKYN